MVKRAVKHWSVITHYCKFLSLPRRYLIAFSSWLNALNIFLVVVRNGDFCSVQFISAGTGGAVTPPTKLLGEQLDSDFK